MSPDGRRIAYGTFDDQKRPAIAVCDFPTCASKRTFPLTGAAKWTQDSLGSAISMRARPAMSGSSRSTAAPLASSRISPQTASRSGASPLRPMVASL